MSAVRYWACFVLGVTAGAAVALMYAPQTGADTRKKLKQGIDDASDYVTDRAGEYSDSAAKAYKKATGAVQDFASTAAGAAKDYANTATGAAKDFASQASDAAGQVSKKFSS